LRAGLFDLIDGRLQQIELVGEILPEHDLWSNVIKCACLYAIDDSVKKFAAAL